jgi:hypothetical protein
LSQIELIQSEQTIIREVQAQSFQRTIFELKNDGFVRIKNALAKYNPQKDAVGIIRTYARLSTQEHLAPNT